MTSPFPIKIHKTGLRFNRGSSDKEYHLVHIVCESGQAMVIKRWGKTGIWGQMDVYQGGLAPALGVRNKIYKEKTGKGYEVTGDTVLTATSLAELKGHLPGYVTKLSADQLDFLVKGASAEVATPAAVKAKPAPEPPPPKPTEAERYAKNPLWGAFS